MVEEKKYSLITLDKGEADAAPTNETETPADEEELIVVSSARGTSTRSLTSDAGVRDHQVRPTVATNEEAQVDSGVPARPQDGPRNDQQDDPQGDEGVPFQRMQTVIIVCLIAVIVLFLIYFNFLR